MFACMKAPKLNGTAAAVVVAVSTGDGVPVYFSAFRRFRNISLFRVSYINIPREGLLIYLL